MRRVKNSVPLHECRIRALQYLRDYQGRYTKASGVACKIWPGVRFTSQGAGAAASRILRNLQNDGLVKWVRDDSDWGYAITSLGRVYLQNQ